MAFPGSGCLYVTNKPDKDLTQALKVRGWMVTTAKSALDASKLLGNEYRIGLIDLRHGYGIEQLPIIEQTLATPQTGWVMLTISEQVTMPAVCRLIEKYCSDYLVAPSSVERIADSVAHASRMLALTREENGDVGINMPGADVVGRSEPMQQLFRTIAKVASTNAPVFISGESGTGKELTASAIHAHSSRKDAPFVAINCGAIPQALVQAELFGYERGAFTGANQRQIGKIEAAHNGTLFLDEIGDLPLESQANLLRFLQEGQIQRVGSHETIDVNVRVICATHVDIKRAVAEGQFRNDLFHRLCVLRIDQPPLRERGDDIELLAMHMLERFRDENPRRIRGFSPSAISALYSYDWPGNVRELINRVRRAVVMAESRTIAAEDLELTQFATAKAVTLAEARDVAEQAAIQQALRRHRNRLADAAQELGISRVTLYRLMGGPRRQSDTGMVEEDEGELRSVA